MKGNHSYAMGGWRWVSICAVLAAQLWQGCSGRERKDPVRWVNPQIGTVSHLLTTTTADVYLPHGMMHVAPITAPDTYDKYFIRKISGFPVGNGSFMPVSGNWSFDVDSNASDFDRDFEMAKPYYLSEQLDRGDIRCEATAGSGSAVFRIHYGQDGAHYWVLSLPGNGAISELGTRSIGGWNEEEGVKRFFYVKFDGDMAPVARRGLAVPASDTGAGKDIRIVLAPEAGKDLCVETGISYISEGQSRDNMMREIGVKRFDSVEEAARNAWNGQLGKIDVYTKDSDLKAEFYTGLYHALSRMEDISEGGHYYSVFDHSVHADSGRDFYTADGLWDSHRVKHPLQMILDPGGQEDMLQSYARMYRQYGTMPLFPFPKGELTYMIGNHLAAFAADAWFKGRRNFDLKTVYEGLRKNVLACTMLPDKNGPKTELDEFYQAHGYFPALRESDPETVKGVDPFYRRQAVSITLEFSYDDYCMALLAHELGLEEDEKLFMRRAGNYANVFNPATGFMSPKMADGNWVPGFDPMRGGRQAGRDYFTECNAWVYTFSVQHDVAGLIRLYGSRAAFISKLDSLFEVRYPGFKFEFLQQFPDMTGLIGMYSQGNEPAFHIPYLYCYAGEPWKTQFRVRQILNGLYANKPLGLSGDDDDGALSSWFVFSSLGFYPVCPGRPYYVIGSPLFERSDIHLPNGKTFTIIARNVSRQNKYIQSATLRGAPWNKPWFRHSDLEEGGELVLEMGPKPNKAWGSSPEDAPPSDGR